MNWILSRGSPTYQAGLDIGLNDFGGILHGNGEWQEFNALHGKLGFPESHTYITINQIEMEGTTFTGPSVGVTPVFVPLEGSQGSQSNERKDWLQLGKDVTLYGGIQSGLILDQSVDIAFGEGRGRYEGAKEFLRKQTNLKSISKITKSTSGAFTTLSIITTFAEFSASDQPGADYAKLVGAGLIIGTNFIPYAGPLISTSLAVADATGQFDFFYSSFDNKHYRNAFFNSFLSGGRTTVGPFKP